MSNIKVMSETLANKIAAGEVVERPANVVKELVENSLDAKSKSIKIELKDAGTSLIKVTDDGKGMNEEDAKNCFKRHATSKIFNLDDLFFITSLGFRGEALPSIASVSKVIMLTSEGETGSKIEIHGGKLITAEKSPSRKGTSVEVRDLFYNTPPRLKYLKTESTELSNTALFIEKIALAHPNVAFNLINNGKTIINTSGSGKLLKVIHELYGSLTSKNMLELKGLNDDYEVSGFISKPTTLKGTRNYMTMIVNGRVVKNIDLNRIINDIYREYKPEGKYPVVALHINTDPTLIDVNIHPTKQDIKFSKFTALEEVLTTEIKKALKSTILIPKVEIKEIKSNNEISIPKEYIIPPEKSLSVKDNQKILSSLFEDTEQAALDFKEADSDIKKLDLYPCGLVLGTYIVAQNDEGMYLIDQHAAEERINYEKILNALKNDQLRVTDLLIPSVFEYSSSDYLVLKEKMHILTELGFKIEEFGINTISVQSHPTWLIEDKEEESTRKIIDLVISLPKKFEKSKFNESIAHTLACKMSVKGNTNICTEEMQILMDKLVLCDNPYNCPHGRPTIITFTKYELKKMFKRVS